MNHKMTLFRKAPILSMLIAILLTSCAGLKTASAPRPTQEPGTTAAPLPTSERIMYYSFVTVSEKAPPEGSIGIASNAYILAPAQSERASTSDPAQNLTAALEAALQDERNGWINRNLKIVDLTFRDGHAEVVLKGEYFGVGDVTLIAARMQILMTLFANSSVQTARVTLNEDTIANMGISHSLQAKPVNYIFTRAEIEAYRAENAYRKP
jgi:hypothetical protein